MMKNLVVFAMIMLLVASGYMYGTKLASDMGINKIPTLDNIGSNILNDHQSGKGTVNTVGTQSNSLNAFFNSLKGLWGLVYNYIVDWIYGIAPTSTKGLNNSNGLNNLPKIISKEDAKEIAQKYIEEPGAEAGEPLLVNYNGKLTYIVPVLLNGKKVGEIYIDAQTGENMGGAGGVSDNTSDNSIRYNHEQDNTSKKINNQSNPDNGNANDENIKETANNSPQTNDSGQDGSVKCIEQ